MAGGRDAANSNAPPPSIQSLKANFGDIIAIVTHDRAGWLAAMGRKESLAILHLKHRMLWDGNGCQWENWPR